MNISSFHISVNQNIQSNMSPYRLVNDSGAEVAEVNRYLDSLAVRGLSPATVRIYAFDLLNFWSWLHSANLNLKNVTQKLLIEYISYQRQGSSPAPVSINHRLTVANCLYQFIFDKRIPDLKNSNNSEKRSVYRVGWIHPIRMRRISQRVKVPQHSVVPLDRKDVFEFFNSLKSFRDIAMTGFMLFCGLRSNEVLNLKLFNINKEQRSARVLGKGNKERVVPLPDQLINVIDKYIRLERPKTDNPFLFVVLKGPHRGQPLTKSALRTIFRYHRMISGVLKANPHRFRHTFGADMARAGISLIVLMKLMGHAQVHTTLRYINLSSEDIREEFNKAINISKNRDILNESEICF